MRRRRVLYGIKVRARAALSDPLRLLLRPRHRVSDLVRLGKDDYGSWWVPAAVLKAGAVAYCAGCGEDISFDQALLEHGMEVVAFDPTPRAIAHIEKLGIQEHPRFRFFPVGWWNEPDEIRFYVPGVPTGVSHSAINLHNTSDYFTAKVDTPAAFTQRLGHEHVALVKVDIEGAETRVVPHMLKHGPRPDVLCVEFDDDNKWRVAATIIKLRLRGYRPVVADAHATFVRGR